MFLFSKGSLCSRDSKHRVLSVNAEHREKFRLRCLKLWVEIHSTVVVKLDKVSWKSTKTVIAAH